MDKEEVVHIHNGILLGNKKEWLWISWIEADEPRACYTEWSKSEREKKQILYIIAYIWNLKKCFWWAYLMGRSRCREWTVDTMWEGEGETNWEGNWNIHTILCKTASSWEAATQNTELHLVLCDDLEGGWERGSRGRGCMYVYGWFKLQYSRNQQSIAKQLFSN